PKRPSAEILAKAAPRLIKAVRECDTTRPITAGLANIPASNATGLADLLDVVGYNYQLEHYEKDMARYPQRKFVGTENGYEIGYYEITQNPRVTGQFLWIGIDYLGEARRWPERGWDNGLLNTCGFQKPRAAFRQSLWSDKPMVYVCVRTPERDRRTRSWQGDFGWQPVESHWNWATDSRAELPVEVYSNCEGVELFLNGKSLGRKSRAEAERHMFRWNVPFQPGELKAIGTPAGPGRPVEYRLVTAGPPARLELLPDQTTLAADGRDVAHIELRLVDEHGVLVPTGNALCAVNVTGAARLLAVDNGNQFDLSPLTATSRKLTRGRALAILQSLRQPGPITLTVTASNLPLATLKLQSTP
ncbi:MAG TPA: DUF4982 domain-containing protein, partial [Bacillota bacterium]|nr:DUF4982 domain-containing protein [Bacillota bacterium]